MENNLAETNEGVISSPESIVKLNEQPPLYYIYKIDRELADPKQIESNTQDATKFVNQLVIDTMENDKKRAYKFIETSSVLSLLEEIISASYSGDKNRFEVINEHCYMIAKRLLQKEILTNDKQSNFSELVKGNLIIAISGDEDHLSIIISKIDSAEFLQDDSMLYQTGLPLKRAALKTAIVKIPSSELSSEIMTMEVTVSDTNSKIASYWVNDFLEITELTSDEKNTKDAYKLISRVINTTLKSKFPNDYYQVNNNLIGYFKKNEDFEYDKMMSSLFDNFYPENEEVNVEIIKQKIEKLKTDGKFETHFTIVSSEIKDRFKNRFKLTPEIELTTNGHIEGLKHKIKAKKNNLGEKVLEIKVDDEEVFKAFSFEEEPL